MAMGKNIGKSLFEIDYLDVAEKLVGNEKIVLPENVVVLDTSNDSVLEKHIDDIASRLAISSICFSRTESLDVSKTTTFSGNTIFSLPTNFSATSK